MSDLVQLIGPAIFLAAPILYAAIGGLFTQRAGIFNIALEGFMLLSAYFSVLGAATTGSLWVGTLMGVGAALAAATVMAVVVVGFHADEVIVGIAVNLFALGLTTFLLAAAQRSGTGLELASGYPVLHIDALEGVPVLGSVFNDRDALVWLLVPVLVGVAYTFRRTRFGLQLQAAGEAPMAARAAGVRVVGVRFASILISGAFCGVAGAQLAIGSVHLFSENMTSGRGIVAFAAVIFGAGMVGRVTLACLLFGFAQALAGLLQIRTDFPPQFVLMGPFLLTIAAITVGDAVRRSRWPRRRRPPGGGSSQRDATPTPVTVLGHLTIDDIRLPDGRGLPSTVGGAAGYAALGVFLAGGQATVVARVGEDYPVERLHLVHPDGGSIEASGVTVVPGRSIHNVAWYGAGGERRFEVEDFDALTHQTPEPGDLRGRPVAGRWVLVSPAAFDQQERLVDALRESGARIALDTELHYFSDDALAVLQRLTRKVDCFLPSREHLRHLFGERAEDPAELPALAATFGAPLVLVKSGAEGVVVLDAESSSPAQVPAVPRVQVADPTGAGDAFNGGFLTGLSRGELPLAAAATGCVAASFVVESTGVEVPATFSGRERTARYHAVSSYSPAATPQGTERVTS